MTGLFDNYGSKIERVDSLSVSLASPDNIRDWSFGEVERPETINYRSYKPEKGGLFCERIFGPVRNWECNCGKYKRVRYRGVVCDRCGVEVTHSRVRRERMGHIELAVPVVHVWYLKSTPSYIAPLLGFTNKELDKIIYYENYVVIDPGDTGYEVGDLIGDDEFDELEDAGKNFVAKMGGEAVFDLLSSADLEELQANLSLQLKHETSKQRMKDHRKRLRVVNSFVRSGNRPENMVLKVLPVLPPDLRPLVPLDGGRFATSDLNDLYRRVINRNNRLKKLIEIKAPEVILRNEKRMLQESVDTLISNGRRGTATGSNNKPMKSLSDLLKGKRGRFRQNLLGKRVDYSGRSVIVIGPELKLYQCGLPKSMALELFKPFVINKLEDREFAQTVKSAKKFVEKESKEVWDVLEEVIKDHPVLLNRAPTLHRLGIQAFFPVLVEGKAIRLHPLVCSPFNADFDGDQMAVHVPLSPEAIIEARLLMLSANNLLRPSSGEPVVGPSQDMVLGIYYLTKVHPDKKALTTTADGKEVLRTFDTLEELEYAFFNKQVDVHTQIQYVVGTDKEMSTTDGTTEGSRKITTTVGRVFFNAVMPKHIPFFNKMMRKSDIENLVTYIVNKSGTEEAVTVLDQIKDMGFSYATRAGASFCAGDLVVPKEREELIAASKKQTDKIRKQYKRGIITEGERYNKIIDIWTHTTNQVADALMEALIKDEKGFNSVHMMIDAKARGSKDQIKQLAGMRGLMQKPKKKLTGGVGSIIENPILSHFLGGLTGLEYFISTHGARKGLADTALKTADAGYLTRRLVDVVQDMVVSEDDCGTFRGIYMTALEEGDEVVEPLSERVVGRTALEDVKDFEGNLLVERNTLITDEQAEAIEESGIEGVEIRSVLTCEADFGICAKCYGRNLANGRVVSVGEAVGTMAAQSIGEPGTQLTLRTFHIGGTASRMLAKDHETANYDGTVTFYDMVVVDHGDGKKVLSRLGEIGILNNDGVEINRYPVAHGSVCYVSDGQKVKAGDKLFGWDPYNIVILSSKEGEIEGMDIVPEVTLRETVDDLTESTERIIIEDKTRKHHPHFRIVASDGTTPLNIALPAGALLQAEAGQQVAAGDVLYKIPRDAGKSRDITGGLPRVAELFEARVPGDPTIMAEIDGIVEFQTRPVKDSNGKVMLDNNGTELTEPKIDRGKRKILIHSHDGEVSKEYSIPVRKHMRVQDGDRVRVGDRLCEGSLDPHEILRVLGEYEVQRFLIDEVQSVYRLQGVKIDDKHIEVVVAQMLRKVVIEDAGDSDYIRGDKVDKKSLRKENELLVEDELQPAVSRPLLQGITKASLGTESFLSAASFQETTKVLAAAAVNHKIDPLRGLKENIIMGNLIPAGSGAKMYRDIEIQDIDVMAEDGDTAVEDFGDDDFGGEII
ncbi:DNA-directed RNA polymerase subunit beta' [Chitinivibrio alkaliphilus]|uniref:DNA-directed RNA polymerase subunit beta' n=1 Tax=Chitinivibrio alkaliphilus ACht1 TaxID=1313304 RepID=U7D7E1_9BACT|nr:DNA-directed RNA polymerase subunit beta' [Chitinivibrio alkaliphilus]ERP31022.1 DNA-directed RNA polymerase, subunit beta-prime [Chitinivibrio alkaliphilus ACht1]